MADHAGDVVIIGARTEEAGVVVQVGVLERKGAEFADQLKLGEGGGEVERGIPVGLGDFEEQVSYGGYTGQFQHGLAVGVSVGDVGRSHGLSALSVGGSLALVLFRLGDEGFVLVGGHEAVHFGGV